MAEAGESTRRDMAVIMARGASVRMGFPKGAAVLEPGQPPLLALVDLVYRDLGWPRTIVTLGELLPNYQALLDPDSTIHWVKADPGGDTAMTLQIAWKSLHDLDLPPTHLWAHPVDLPLVKPGTIAIIREQSILQPEKIIRPVHAGQPGHPVVLPFAMLAGLFGSPDRAPVTSPMRDLLARCSVSGSMVELSVEDTGIVRDFDHPDSLRDQ